MIANSWMRVTQIAAIWTFTALGFAAIGAAQDSKVYWTDPGTGLIERSNLDGSAREPVLSGLGSVVSIALDIAGGKMYWSDNAGTVRRANLDGSGVEDLVTGLAAPLGIALDVAAGKMYYVVESPPRMVQRADLNGANVETLVSGLGDPHYIALDLGIGKMYITDATGCSCIRRFNLDGSVPEVLVSGIADPFGIALDLDSGKMYWTDANPGGGGVDSARKPGRVRGRDDSLWVVDTRWLGARPFGGENVLG